MNTGSCLCGKVRYKVEGRLGDVRYCYCVECRKASGSSYTANAQIPSENFEILKGEHILGRYESSPGKFRFFCSNCASPVYAKVMGQPGFVRVRLGGLDFEPQTRITAHMWVNEKPKWCAISDDLPQYETIYDGSKD